jgi:hypothetical protein
VHTGNDRGVALAHHQIWTDFVYQGKKGSDAPVARNADLLIVFEDDATITVNNITFALEKELANMPTDILFLGWCYGRRFMPMVRSALSNYISFLLTVINILSASMLMFLPVKELLK